MSGLKTAGELSWFLLGLKADCVPGWSAMWLPSGLKADCVLGWITVWLPLGHEGCWLSRPWVVLA